MISVQTAPQTLLLRKESLNNSTNINKTKNHLLAEHKKDQDMWHWKSRSWFVTDTINSCAKSAWYARRQHSYNICIDFLSHNSRMKNRNFTKKYTDHKTINSNNYAKFEVNWPRGSQFTARHTKNYLKIMYNLMNKVP